MYSPSWHDSWHPQATTYTCTQLSPQPQMFLHKFEAFDSPLLNIYFLPKAVPIFKLELSRKS